MLWVYYSAQILLFGAAIAWTIDGVRAEQPRPQTGHEPKAGGADRIVAATSRASRTRASLRSG